MEKIKKKCMEGKNVIIGGDFNIRIGELGGEDLEDDGKNRRSKDKMIRNGGRGFVELMTEYGWHILNERSRGDWEEEYT